MTCPINLMYFISEGDLEKVQSFDVSTTINCRNRDEWTTLHMAAFYGQLNIVKYLVQKGADINATTATKCSVLYLSIQPLI